LPGAAFAVGVEQMDRRVTVAMACALTLTGCGDEDTLQYDCSVFPAAETSPYVLPWHIGQTFSTVPHATHEEGPQKYAQDVQMSLGTQVLAIQDGVVVRVEESYIDGDHTPGHENYVYVAHDDGTVARYVHLTNLGANVEMDQPVQKGDLIGYSGDTGNSSGPHLHLDVIKGCDVRPPAAYLPLSLCETIPLNFSNAKAATRSPETDLSCGLERDVFYTALAY
jgi:murein DD-endopeptidase MepM/ murein hydrolase activator NlpD